MNPSRFLLHLCLLTLPLQAAPLHAEPSPEAAALITELGLRAAAAPVQPAPGWQPQRVIVMLPRDMGTDTADFVTRLRAAAGDVQLVFNSSGELAP